MPCPTPPDPINESVPLQVNICQKSILLIVQFKYLKSCSSDFILQNLILRTRLCCTGFVTQPSWVCTSTWSIRAGGNFLYHSCTGSEGASGGGQPFNIFTWFTGIGAGGCIRVCESVIYLWATTSSMGWLRLVGSSRLKVSFAKESYKRDDILQKRFIILRSLLTVAVDVDVYPAFTYLTQKIKRQEKIRRGEGERHKRTQIWCRLFK